MRGGAPAGPPPISTFHLGAGVDLTQALINKKNSTYQMILLFPLKSTHSVNMPS